MEQNRKKLTSVALWKNIFKKWYVFVVTFVLCLGIGVTYSFVVLKPTYTVHRAMVLKMTVSDEIDVNSNFNNATLISLSLPTVKEWLMSSKVATSANDYYNSKYNTTGENIDKAAINVNATNNSFILQLSYTDLDKDDAIIKLEAILQTAPDVLTTEIEAESIKLEPVQNVYNVTVNSGRTTPMLLSGVVGLVLGAGALFLAYVFSNNKRLKQEQEANSAKKVEKEPTENLLESATVDEK